MANKNSAGEYRYQWQWFQYTPASADSNNDQPEQFGTGSFTNTNGFNLGSANAVYWGTEEKQQGYTEKLFGATRTGWIGQVRLRCVLDNITPQDLIQGGRTNTLCKIDDVWTDWEGNQTILQVRSITFST
jgi:hypothetical protein